MWSRCALATLALLLHSAASYKVAVTGAAGKTGQLAFKLLTNKNNVDVIGTVRKTDKKTIRKVVKTVQDKEKVKRDLHAVDVTQGPGQLAKLLKDEKVDALLIATSASPKISMRSLLKLLLFKLIGRKGMRPTFKFRPGGTPEEVDWLGQKAQIDAALEAGVSRIVICSSMGGTQPDNFLNSIGKKPDGTGGDILKWKRKAEEYAIKSGIEYTIIHPGGLLDKPGGRRILLGVDDELLERKVRSIPREDVAEIMVESLFLPQLVNRSIDIISEDVPREQGELVETLSSSTDIGNCDYSKSPGSPASMFMN